LPHYDFSLCRRLRHMLLLRDAACHYAAATLILRHYAITLVYYLHTLLILRWLRFFAIIIATSAYDIFRDTPRGRQGDERLLLRHYYC